MTTDCAPSVKCCKPDGPDGLTQNNAPGVSLGWGQARRREGCVGCVGDWTVRENVRAHLQVLVGRILRKYGYPPDKQEKATLTVLEQAEVLSANGAMA
jgi:hypothetical protein